MQLEKYMTDLAAEDDKDASTMDSTRSIVPVLQEAAQKIRMVAMDLRPPSLDDFGLKAAINSLISECHASAMEVEVALEFSVSERDLTSEKKSILYRMLKDALKSLCFKHDMRGHAVIALEMSEGQLTLQFTMHSERGLDLGYESLPDYLESVQERTILSGGKFDFKRKGNSIESLSVWTLYDRLTQAGG
jgi:signal transduction histidine kinase